MADLKNLQITSFQVRRETGPVLDKDGVDTGKTADKFYMHFQYTSDNGSGEASGICCDGADACLAHCKQMIANTWPG